MVVSTLRLMGRTSWLGAAGLKDPASWSAPHDDCDMLAPSSAAVIVMQGKIDRNDSLTHRSFLAVRGRCDQSTLLLRRACRSPVERLSFWRVCGAFFSEEKTGHCTPAQSVCHGSGSGCTGTATGSGGA